MRFQIEKKELIRHIQHLASIVPSKNNTPILTNYLLEANEETNRLRITASDLEITVNADFAANVMESGITTVSAHSFNEIVSAMPDEMLNITKVDEELLIQCRKIQFKLLCADHTLYPIIPERSMHNAVMLDADVFERMVSKTSFAVSTDVNRAVLNGVCWVIYNDRQMMAATDGRKVAEIIYMEPLNQQEASAAAEETTELELGDIGLQTSTAPDYTSGVEKILPIKTLSFLQKIFDDKVKEIAAVIEANRVMFVYGEYTIFTHVIEHKYPDYQKAFIHDLPNVLLVEKDALRTTIRRIALIAPSDNLRIRFELSSDTFEINTVNRDEGEAKENIESFTYNGSPASVSFNYKYMISILDAIDSEKVQIKLGAAKDPIMIYNEAQPEAQEITFLLMPLRS